MKHAKIVAWGLTATFITMALTMVFMEVLAPELSDALFLLVGCGMWIFGIWAIVILFKNKK